MARTDDDVTYTYDYSDIPLWLRLVLIVLLAAVVISTTGCATSKPIEQVKRHPPAAAMVRLEPLPQQTDPTLGGIFRGYVNAAQKYRGCVDRLTELQDWVSVGEENQR